MSLFNNDKWRILEITRKLDCIADQNGKILDYLQRLDAAVPETVSEMEKAKAVKDFLEKFLAEYAD